MLEGAPEDAPLALWRQHGRMAVGATVRIVFGPHWPAQRAADVLHGAGFSTTSRRGLASPAGVTATRERTLADTTGAGLRLLCVGLNPSVYSADAGIGFARPGNRFWPAMLAAGLATTARDPLGALVDHGIGMTDLVKRATPRAHELSSAEYAGGLGRVERLCEWLAPAAVCVLGLAGWRLVVDRRASPGWQGHHLGGRPTYLMPNPSGLNAHVQVPDLAEHLRAAATAPASRTAESPPTARRAAPDDTSAEGRTSDGAGGRPG